MRVRRRRRASLPPARREVEPYDVADPSVAARFDRWPLASRSSAGRHRLSERARDRRRNRGRGERFHDAEPGVAETMAASFGGSVATDLEQALDPERADAVFLSVPHDLHTPLVVRAAEAGLNVVVEKPLAHDLAAAEEAVAAAERAGIAFSVCFAFRYHRTVQAARELVRFGALGDLRGSSVLFHADKPPCCSAASPAGRRPDGAPAEAGAGGGVLVMNLAHYPFGSDSVHRRDRGDQRDRVRAHGSRRGGRGRNRARRDLGRGRNRLVLGIGEYAWGAAHAVEALGERGSGPARARSAAYTDAALNQGSRPAPGLAGAGQQRRHAEQELVEDLPRRSAKGGSPTSLPPTDSRSGLHRCGVPLDRRRRAGGYGPPGVSGLTGAAE